MIDQGFLWILKGGLCYFYAPCDEPLFTETGTIDMSLEKQDVEKIAHLARLAVDEAAIPGYAEDLSGILDLVDQMSAVDTDGVEPLAHPHDAIQRLREDVVTEENQRELLQSNAPQTDAGLFLVPKVIE